MSDNARAHLIHAFRKVLRELVKILIRAGVQFDEFVEVIKGVYVESAIRDGIGSPGPITRGRITVATGLTRRDVDRFVDNEALLSPPAPTHVKTMTEVLHLWNTDPRYLGPYGLPLEIDFDSTPGRCFSELVARANPTVDPAYVLQDLISNGVVAESGEKFLRVKSRSYVFGNMLSAQSLEYFGSALTSLAKTLEHNTAVSSDEKRLQRSVVADNGMPEVMLPEFQTYVKDRVQQMLADIDDWIGQHVGPTEIQGPDQKVVGTGVTVFHYVEEAEDKAPLASKLAG